MATENRCACVYVYDGAQAEFYNKSLPRAKKEHKCSECGRVIKPGERYERVRGKWEEGISIYLTCADCLSVREAFFCDGFCHTMIWEDMSTHLNEIGGQVKSECLKDLTKRGRDKVLDLIDEIWEEDEEV